MAADTTTFAAAFACLFLLLAGYLWRLDRRARRLEERLARLEPAAEDPAAPEARP
jgi:CcmD family protein